MTNSDRAQNVCHTCKLRKKACDKALPACGFCKSRHLPCRYALSDSRSQNQPGYHPGRSFVLLGVPSSADASVLPRAGMGGLSKLPAFVSGKGYGATIYPSPGEVPWSAEESLDHLAQHLLRWTGLDHDTVIHRYFQTSHKWMPVISAEALLQDAIGYQERCCLAPADHTALLLAIFLITLPTLGPGSRSPLGSRETLYRTIKSAFGQAQASIGSSVRLLQAALLIAVCEYASGRPATAYISTMACIGMADILGIGVASMKRTRDARGSNDPSWGTVERRNLVWAIAMFERYECLCPECI